MLLQIRFSDAVHHAESAAFIRGSSPAEWLMEISRWNISADQLECYIVPESIASIHAAGIFVIFKPGISAGNIGLDAYGVIGGKLYIPVHATIFPEVSEDELKKLLLYDMQLFHPTIGMVGFDIADKVDLASCLEFQDQENVNWNFAHPGIPYERKLTHIHVQQLSVEEVLASFKESIETKPLGDIPKKKEDEHSALTNFVDGVKRNVLKGILSVMQGVKNVLKSERSKQTTSRTAGNTPANTAASGEGVLDRFENWLIHNLEALEKKRNDEIQRLLKMFDEDPEEALKYALPLDNPYLHRGNAAPTDKLTRQSTTFDVRRIGGGGRADVWYMDNYYSDLRTKYQRAAQKEIEARDFKKAAYIYAHLLGDFSSAANVLEQGKHYREAAVLYKDHLKNPALAAECLERGGLLSEAIDLYVDLKKHEKAGDLYVKIDQREQADHFYELCVDASLRNDDYLEATRIIQHKLKQAERTKEYLLKGWVRSKQPEACLKNYFDLLLHTESSKVSRQVKEIFNNHTAKTKRSSFLNVLVQLTKTAHKPEFLQTSRDIAYQIISDQVKEGDTTNVYNLKNFIPGDKLIGSDCGRFMAQFKRKPKGASDSFLLDKSVQWSKVVNHRNQFLVLGVRNSMLQLARGNWYGNIEYYSWNDLIGPASTFSLIANPYESQDVILHLSSGIALEDKILPRNKYFEEELIIRSPAWLSQGFLGLALITGGGIVAIKNNNYIMTAQFYNRDLALQRSMDCKLEGDKAFVMTMQGQFADVIFRDKHCFTFIENLFFKIPENGSLQNMQTGDAIKKISASPDHTKLQILVAMKHTVFLYIHTEGAMYTLDMVEVTGDITDIKFLTSDRFAVAGKHSLLIYQLEDTNTRVLTKIETETSIVSILTTSIRNKIAVLDNAGKIQLISM